MSSPDKQTFAATVISVLKGIKLLIKGNASIIGDNTGDQIDKTLPFSDNTVSNASTEKHGYLSKLPNSAIVFLNGLGLWAVPAGTGVVSVNVTAPIVNTGTALNPIIGFKETTQASIVAHAGGGQALATPILADINSVDIVANPLDSVLLPLATEGRRVYIYNNGTNALNVYPQSGQFIKGSLVNIPFKLTPFNGRWFTCYVATPSEIGTFRVF